MKEKNTFDPYDEFTKLSNQWEKHLNDLFRLNTTGEGFLRFAKVSSDSNIQFKEFFNKYQDTICSELNLPTKKDLSNVAKLSIQTEEKIEALEEQIWKLQDSFQTSNKEFATIKEVSQEVLILTKQLKSDLSKTQVELSEAKELRKELQEMKKDLKGINQLKADLSILLERMNEKKVQRPKRDQELSVSNSK